MRLGLGLAISNPRQSAGGVAAPDYVVNNDTDWTNTMAIGAATLSGKVIEIRGAITNVSMSGKSFSSPTTVRCAAGGSIRRLNLTGPITNLTLKNCLFQMSGWPKAHNESVYFNNGSYSGIVFDGCTFRHGYGAGLVDYDTTAQLTEYTRVDNVQTATTASAAYALTWQDPVMTSGWVEFFNRGAATVYVKFGTAGVVATTGDTAVPAGGYLRFSSASPANSTHVAILAASGTVQVNARTEIGLLEYVADAFGATGGASLADLTLKNCSITDMGNGFKGLPIVSGVAVMMDCSTRRVYMDQSAVTVSPTGSLYVLRNSFGIPFSRQGIPEASNGDARDPHSDLIQHFASGTGKIGPIYLAGNRTYHQAVRGGVGAQGAFISDNNFSPSYDLFFSISDMFLGGMPNGMASGEAGFPVAGFFIYGDTVVDPRDITATSNLVFQNVAASQHVYIGKTLSAGRAVAGMVIFDGGANLAGVSNPALVFSNMAGAIGAADRTALDAAMTTVGAYAGMGAAAAANAVDWTTSDYASVIKWDQLPSGADWDDLTAQPVSTLTTLALRRILNRRAGQTVSVSAGTEWQSYASDGVTVVQAWTTSSGTIQPDQFIAIRGTTSASNLTATTLGVTINGFLQSVSLTTAAATPSVYHTQSGTGPYFRDPANAIPGSTTRMEWAANVYIPSAVATTVKLFSQESTGCDFELLNSGLMRLTLEDGAGTALITQSGVGNYLTGQWVLIELDVDMVAGTAITKLNGSVVNTKTFTAANQTFQTAREISFLGSSTGTNLAPSGILVDYLQCYFTTGGTRTLRKLINGNAATVNADGWKLGGNAT